MRPLLLLGERPGADLPTLSSQPDQRMPFSGARPSSGGRRGPGEAEARSAECAWDHASPPHCHPFPGRMLADHSSELLFRRWERLW